MDPIVVVPVTAGCTLFGVFMGWRARARLVEETGTTPASPRVVVNVPTDYQPLRTLTGDTKVIENEKALLWWTVYSKAVDNGHHMWAADDADDALTAVYGEE